MARARRALGAACVALLVTTAPAAGSSSHFGRWTFDRFGLPAFVYGVDQRTDPLARQPELKGATAAQHQVGNDRIVGQAFNHGYTQLWSQERRAAVGEPLRRLDAPLRRRLRLAARRRADAQHALPGPPGAGGESASSASARTGTGRAGCGFEVDEDVYAPFGDDPVLVHDVVDPQPLAQDQAGLVVRVLGRQPVRPRARPRDRGRRTALDPRRRTLSARQLPGDGDNRPLTVFLAALRGPVRGHETLCRRLLRDGHARRPGGGGRRPARRHAGHAAGTGRALFALRAPGPPAAGRGGSPALRLRARARPPGGADRDAARPAARPGRGLGPPLGALAAARRLRRAPALGRARARLGRLPAALRHGLRGGLRPPHGHAGRLLPVRLRPEPRVAQLAALRAAARLHAARAGAGDPALLDLAPVARPGSLQPAPLRHRLAVPPGRARQLERSGLLAAARRGRVRAGRPGPALLRRPAALLRGRRGRAPGGT